MLLSSLSCSPLSSSHPLSHDGRPTFSVSSSVPAPTITQPPPELSGQNEALPKLSGQNEALAMASSSVSHRNHDKPTAPKASKMT